jgi:predicted ATP-grasp superfamily ATP-dependent carboligase
VLASVHMDVLATERDTGPSCVVKRVDSEYMSDAAEKIAGHYQLSGLHGLDYIRDAAGEVHLLEINPRATGISYLPLGPHGDLLASLAGCISDGRVEDRSPAIIKDIIAFYPQEIVRDPESIYLNTAHHDIPVDDPAVMQILAKSARRALARKSIKKILIEISKVSARANGA